MHPYVTITHTSIRTHPHTLTHLQPHTNEIPTVFCLYFFVFSIFNSFHLLNCLRIVAFPKTSWNPGLQTIFPELNTYIWYIFIYYIYIHTYIYIYIYIYIRFLFGFSYLHTDRHRHTDPPIYIYIYIYIYLCVRVHSFLYIWRSSGVSPYRVSDIQFT